MTPFARVPLAYLALYVIVSWPVALSPAHLVPCDKADGFFDMLLFWYARKGLFMSANVTELFYPAGVALGPEKAYWLVPLMSVPLQWLMPLPAVFNLLIAVFFVATASSVYLLSRDLGASRAGAGLAGALFVLSPAYLNELSHGIPENMCVQWPLLFVVFGLRATREGERRNAVLAAAFFLLSWLTSWYLGAIATLLAVALPLRRLARPLAVAALLVGVTVAAISSRGGITSGSWDGASADALLGALSSASTATSSPPPAWGSGATRYVDAVVALRESDLSVWGARQVLTNSCDLGGVLRPYRPNRMRDILPGLFLLGLAALGLWRAPQRCTSLLVFATFFGLLSLGPVVSFGGQLVCSTPLELLYRLVPLMARLRPARFMLAASLALALMSAFSTPRLRSVAMSGLLVVALVLMAWVEVQHVHVAHYNIRPTSADIPATYDALASPTTEAVIDLPLIPFDLAAGRHAYYQTRHGRPMLNYDFVSLQSLARLADMARGNAMICLLLGVDANVRQADAVALVEQGFGTLIVHTRVPPSRHLHADPFLFTAAWIDVIEQIYGPARVTPDGLLLFDMRALRAEAWDEDGRLRRADAERLPVQRTLQQHVSRGERCLLVSRLGVEKGRKNQELRGWISGRGAHLVVAQGEREIARFVSTMDDWQWVRLDLASVRGLQPLRVFLEASADAGSEGCDASGVILRWTTERTPTSKGSRRGR